MKTLAITFCLTHQPRLPSHFCHPHSSNPHNYTMEKDVNFNIIRWIPSSQPPAPILRSKKTFWLQHLTHFWQPFLRSHSIIVKAFICAWLWQSADPLRLRPIVSNAMLLKYSNMKIALISEERHFQFVFVEWSHLSTDNLICHRFLSHKKAVVVFVHCFAEHIQFELPEKCWILLNLNKQKLLTWSEIEIGADEILMNWVRWSMMISRKCFNVKTESSKLPVLSNEKPADAIKLCSE